MSKANSGSDSSRAERTTAEDVYDEHQHTVEALADRDDEIGAVMRAIKRVGGDSNDA